MTIIGISGSLRSGSFNTMLLRHAQSLLPEGVTLDVVDITGIPFFDADVEAAGTPDVVLDIKRRITEADGVLIATPEYNYSYTGVIKNALDWLSRGPVRPFMDKPVAVIGASNGNFGSVRAQTDMRRLLHGMGANVLPKPELLVTQAPSKFDADGRLIDEATQNIYRTLLQKFVVWIERLRITESV
jgi:chromate reductase, NAD(P)H dehydrogenase (quinone)